MTKIMTRNLIFFLLCFPTDVIQYGRYGKTRAEEDAKRYRRQKEELEKQKEELRNTLISLRKEKKVLKEEVKSGPGQRGKRKKKAEPIGRRDSCHVCLWV